MQGTSPKGSKDTDFPKLVVKEQIWGFRVWGLGFRVPYLLVGGGVVIIGESYYLEIYVGGPLLSSTPIFLQAQMLIAGVPLASGNLKGLGTRVVKLLNQARCWDMGG